MRNGTEGKRLTVSPWPRGLWAGLAFLSMVAMAMPSHAAINDCGTDDGTPAGMFNSACANLGVFAGGTTLGSGFTINTAGNDFEADVEAALADLGISANLESLGKTDDNPPLNFEFFDLSTDPATSIGTNPAGTSTGGWKYVPGQKIVDFLTIKASTSFKIYRYVPAASDGRYSTTGLINNGGQQANVSHITAWRQVPEPASLALLAFGVIALVALRRRRVPAVVTTS